MKKRSDYLKAIRTYGDNFQEAEFLVRAGAKIVDLDFGHFSSFLRWRRWTGVKTLITSAFREGDDGAHGEGLALDCILFESWLAAPAGPRAQWTLATTWPFWGVGIYFDWSFRDPSDDRLKPAVGLHLDSQTDGDRPRRWLRLEDENGEKLYYYQNTSTGIFYNQKTQRTVRLSDVIERIWEK